MSDKLRKSNNMAISSVASEKIFLSIGEQLIKTQRSVQISQMFGKPCLKIKGKAFSCFFQNEMVFKLHGKNHELAMNLNGSQLFDPSGKKRPMKEWVQVTFDYSKKWKQLALSALEYVSAGKKI